ncbi:tripartite tricarboxylate transporter substrate binding protein [Aquabacterium sp. J223]|uniref:Bug family tripartite tricarboxylate transporter substrate binding protein n=1 Tax=Aquabacterium sp. J223 TaxID=2898431 RepID=UPI0021AD8394|nr:tripartite tricarboxylate transporter substrate binding protein [Aquabacterium sp. J223]UUX94974.1 tripartite tricarboxylate transporter substrate binding protein [Aquabacterium sp. J223]
MNRVIRSLLSLLASSALLMATGAPRAAEPFPTKPLTLIVPFTGGPADTIMRALAEQAGKDLGQAVVVVNRPGAGGSLGPVMMAKTAKPDGYTVSMFSASLLSYPHMNKVDWNPLTDFTYIIGLTSDSLSLQVASASPLRTMEDLVAWARANPGRLTYGSPGVGTTMHLVAENLFRKLGVSATHVPYKGTAEVIRALVAGEVMVTSDLAGANLPFVAADRVRYLLQFNAEPAPYMANVPTARQKGYDTASSTIGIVGPKGMPEEVVQRLHAAFSKALTDPATEKLLDDLKKERWLQGSKAYADWAARMDESMKDTVRAANLQGR